MSFGVGRRAVVRAFAAVLLASAVTTTVAAVAPAAALADSTYTMESQFVAKMNAARQAAGLRPYSVASDLTSVARQHSAQMAARQSLYHNPNLTSDVQNWQAVGENVGEGPTVSDIHDAFMHSPEHKANILDHDFTQVGVGVSVDKNGIVWVTEDFRQPLKSATTTTKPAATHHATTTTTTRLVSRPAAAPKPVATAHVAATPHPAAKPAPAASPQQKLLAKLTAMRSAQQPTKDPVAGAFDYLSAVTDLTTAGA